MKKKSGFYIILLIGIGLIATTTIRYSKRNVQNLDKDELEKTRDFVILEEEPSLEITQMDEEPNIDDYIANRKIRETFENNDEIGEEIEGEFEEIVEEDEDEDEGEDEEDPDYTFVDSNSYVELEPMIKPVEGPLGMSFTNENLTYWKT